MMINLILLIAMTGTALWAVMARSLLKATIGLALTSAVVTILMFRLASPLAAVFELSVCTGLITAVFVSAISMTRPLTHTQSLEASKNKFKRYWYLPVIMVIVAATLVCLKVKPDVALPQVQALGDVRSIMWNLRQLDMCGQIVILLAGAFGVVILFRDKDKEE
jgi:NADH-quinone oxidoreductase subunit J